MLARLLCPGPSLANYDPGDFAGLVIGVNRAAIAFACDAWAALDPGMVRTYRNQVHGSPVLVTSGDVPNILAREQIRWRGPVVGHRQLIEFLPITFNYLLFSATTGLIYASLRGATRIDVHGRDWSGTLDYDGVAAGSNRTDQRWAQEAEIWKATVALLDQRGIAVTINPLIGETHVLQKCQSTVQPKAAAGQYRAL